MFIKTGHASFKKKGEYAHGDSVLIKRYPNSDKITAVLSDGLGSGIKANILSTLTSIMLLKFAQNGADLIKSAEIVMDSLPVCKTRGISYSTFSVITADENGSVKIIEEGNPDFLLVQNNEIVEVPHETIASKSHKGRRLKVYNLQLEINDILVFVTDGVTQAGLGSELLKEGFGRNGLIRFILNYIQKYPGCGPKELAEGITRAAKSVSDGGMPHDDMTALVLKVQKPKTALVFTGPPFNNEDDSSWALIFSEFKGKKAVSGGTTAKILARELKKTIEGPFEQMGGLPGVSYMENADLVTEGILTLSRTFKYLNEENFETKHDAASKLAKFLLEADNINFIVGARVNTAHYDPNLPVEIELRKDVVKKMAEILREKYLKKVVVQYM